MSAGELADHFEVSKPTMSAHFSVLTGAGLIQAEKHGRSIIYRLRLSVLEDALLGFLQAFGLTLAEGRDKTPKPIGRKNDYGRTQASVFSLTCAADRNNRRAHGASTAKERLPLGVMRVLTSCTAHRAEPTTA